jgi:hypothetical protein
MRLAPGVSACLLAVATTLAAGLLAAGCEFDNPVASAAALDLDYFTCEVQPVLDRECSFPACHGNAERGLRLVSPGRMRIVDEYLSARTSLTDDDVAAGIHPPLTGAELAFNYGQCAAFVDPDWPAQESQLLLRPLALASGGLHHLSAAGDVFLSSDAPGYARIARWLEGAGPEECP